MSVKVAEVARVDAPGAVVRLVGNGGAGCLGSGEERVNVGSAPDDVAEAELAALRRPLPDCKSTSRRALQNWLDGRPQWSRFTAFADAQVADR
jgi:hypothetical protein